MAIAQKTIPKGWEKINLGVACNFERGIEPGADAYNSEGIGERFLRVVDITESRNDPVYVDIRTTKKLKENDIAFTLDGTIGAVRTGLSGAYSTGMRKVSFKNGANSNQLLYYILQSNAIQRIIDVYASGSTIKHASSAIPHLFTVVSNSSSERNKIAEILATIDGTIEKTDALIEKYKRMKTGMMQDLFRYGIDAEGKIRSEKTHKFKNSPLGKIPEEWEIKKVVFITDKVTKGESPNWQGFSYQEDGVLFITSENVRNGYLDFDLPKYIPQQFHSKLKRSKLQRNDMLINLVGASIARSALFDVAYDANINQAVALVRFNITVVPRFYLHYLQIPQNIDRLLEEQVETARANLSLANIKNFLVIKPSKTEQLRVVEILSAIDNTITSETANQRKLSAMKRGLMEDLLTGAVRVNHSVK